jgi:predicted dehydrogenase
MVCSRSEANVKEFAQTVGDVRHVQDYRELLSEADIEAVDIIVPVHLHYQVAKAAMEAGKHLILEKPLAATIGEAESLVALDEQYPQVKMVAENFRYRSVLLRVKELLEYGSIGKPYAVICTFCALIDMSNPYANTKWRTEHVFPGGFVTDVGIHYAAQLRLLFGEIFPGHALNRSINPQIGKMDSFSLRFTTGDDVVGILNIFLSAKNYFQEGMVILGTEGTITAVQVGGEFGDAKIAVHREGKTSEESFHKDTGFIEEFTDFYQAVREGKKPASTILEASKDLKVIFNALKLGNREGSTQTN